MSVKERVREGRWVLRALRVFFFSSLDEISVFSSQSDPAVGASHQQGVFYSH